MEGRTPEELGRTSLGLAVLLYDSPVSGNCYKVRLLLAYLGIPYERAEVLQWMFFEQYDHEPAIAVVRFWLHYTGVPAGLEDRFEEKVAAGYRALGAMERHLEGHAWFAGDAYSLADIALYAYTHVAHEGNFELDRFPAVGAWLARVAAVPGHVLIDA